MSTKIGALLEKSLRSAQLAHRCPSSGCSRRAYPQRSLDTVVRPHCNLLVWSPGVLGFWCPPRQKRWEVRREPPPKR